MNAGLGLFNIPIETPETSFAYRSDVRSHMRYASSLSAFPTPLSNNFKLSNHLPPGYGVVRGGEDGGTAPASYSIILEFNKRECFSEFFLPRL